MANTENIAACKSGTFLDILGPRGHSPIWGPSYGVEGEQQWLNIAFWGPPHFGAGGDFKHPPHRLP